MEVRTKKYTVAYHEPEGRVVCQGFFMESKPLEYEPVAKLLRYALESHRNDALTLDISKLAFANSSGLNVFYQWAIQASDSARYSLTLTLAGRGTAAWQDTLFKNLAQLMPRIVAEWQ